MNIELHGFSKKQSKKIKTITWELLLKNLLYEDAVNCVVTSRDCDTQDYYGKKAPFFRVYSDKVEDFDFVERHLKSASLPGLRTKIFVESILLHKCSQL